MQVFTEPIRAAIAEHAGLQAAEIKLEAPKDAAMGDLAFPCFALAKREKKAPPAIAGELAAKLSGALQGIAVVATGPYLNFKIDRATLARTVLSDVLERGDRYGESTTGAGKTIVVDFSSPNIAKPMHVGHLRSTILGQTLVRLFTALGYRVVGINHIGDWGSQFGGLVVALRRWRAEVDLENEPVHGLLELYQRSKKAVEADPQFANEAREAWRELESGRDGEVRALWRWITEVSLRAFGKTYERLGIRHDLVRGESFYESLIDATFARVEASGVAEISDGALVVQLGTVEKSLAETPCLLKQRDGTTLYATRDLAALFQRYEEFRFERALYVVGGEQKLHFRQLKAVLKRMKADFEPRVQHVDFGLLLGPGRTKLASRKGAVLVLDELIDEVVEEATRVLREKQDSIEPAERLAPAELARVAEAVGIGALVFNDQKRERIKDVLFDKSEVVSFEGDTGPYLQYTHARYSKILRKAKAAEQDRAAPDWTQLEETGPIVLALARFPEVVEAAADQTEPSLLANYLLALGRDLNSWYRDHRVLDQEPGLTAARLTLVRASKTVIANGLRLLGPAALDEM